MLQLPTLPPGWSFFANSTDGILALVSGLFVFLLIIWWRQRTKLWLRIALATLLMGMVLCTASYYLFYVPAYSAGCPTGCTGHRGYPLPVALVTLQGRSLIAPIDFALNLLVLWLLWLAASVVWYLAALGFDWQARSLRFRLLFVLILVVLPWAILPRVLDPPQPEMAGEELRIAINGRRAAEFTSRITGLWVLRLALEDVKRVSPEQLASPNAPQLNQVCLRGYTWFFIPWKQYRVDLDATGVTLVGLQELALDQPCW